VARVSKRSDIFFRLSPAENLALKSFSIQQGDVKIRFDPSFHLPNPDLPGFDGFPSCYPSVPINRLITNIIQPKEFIREYVEESPEAVPCLRAANVRDGELNVSDLVFIPRNIVDLSYRAFEASFIQEGDILITRTGAKAGETCIVPSLNRGFIISSHSIRIIPDESKVNPKYLELFLLSRWGKAQIHRLFTGAAQKQLQLATVAELEIVVPPFPEDQQRLVVAMDEARLQRKQKLAEADSLLSSLDVYLLNTLGLDRPVEDDRKVFAIRTQDIHLQERLNSDYFHPERILALRAMTAAAQTINCQRLEDVVSFVRDKIKTPGDNYLGLAHVQSNTGELTNVEDTATGDCFTFHSGDVLFARLRPYLNKVYCAEMDGCCSPEFHVLRINDNNFLLPDYLAVILRSRLILAQTIHMMTGNTHPRLTNDDVINLVIPIPDLRIQNQISEEIQHRREEARRLKSEAEVGWQEAKKWFEEQLLGSVSL
jgi:type I restriction enzyme S subunit